MTTPIGFPPQRSQAVMQTLLDQLRDRADTAREEAVTGRRADLAKALGGRVGEAIGIKRDLEEIDGYRKIIALAESRAQATQGVLANLQDLTDELANQGQLALQNGAENGLRTMSSLARDSLGAAVSGLNTAIGGRSLFSGDAGDARALAEADAVFAEAVAILEAAPDAGTAAADLQLAFDGAGGVFETTIYGGGAGDAPAAEIAEGERIDYSARADEQPIRDLLRNFAVLAAAYDPAVALDADTRRGLVERASAELRNVTDPLNRVVARIGAAEGRMEGVKAAHLASDTMLTRAFNEFAGADALSAAADLQAIEGQLETLFLTTARMSRLSLQDFLR
jgi:flagellar hook-associated protein 3 FlgL